MDRDGRTAIFIVLAIALGPHVLWLPIWVTVWCFALWIYAWPAPGRNWYWPSGLVRTVAAAAGLFGVFLTFGTIAGRDAGVAMLAILLSVKPFEMRTHRDRMMTVFLAYFLILSNLLETQNLVMTVYLVLAVLAATSALIMLNHNGVQPKKAIRRAGVLVAQAVPLMIILFILFPRLPASLFRLPDTAVRSIGFSDSMAPGDISRLVRTDEVAFRAEFENGLPAPNLRYWRGLVLWDFDGITWTRGVMVGRGGPPDEARGLKKYSITIEPHNHKWIYALDMPAMSPIRGVWMRADGTLSMRRELKKRVRFDMTSTTDYEIGPVKYWERALGLKLPKTGNERSRALARDWASKYGTPGEIVNAALSFFTKNEFHYTLQPPPLGRDRIDDFLFRTRAGYCEHYASGFAFLMRAAGIPARIVIGFQGGEVNPNGGYMIVKQSDAHAWVEVALPDVGWTRVDPTAAVAPNRVDQGVEAALPQGELAFLFGRNSRYYKYWKSAVLKWDRVNYLYNNWVLDYTHDRQRNLLSILGMKADSFRDTVIFLMVALLLVGAAIFGISFYVLLSSGKRSADRVRQIYDRFCRKAAKTGQVRPPYMGPLDYADRLAESRPDLEPQIREITERFILLRYGKKPNAGDDKKLKKLVNQFNP